LSKAGSLTITIKFRKERDFISLSRIPLQPINYSFKKSALSYIRTGSACSSYAICLAWRRFTLLEWRPIPSSAAGDWAHAVACCWPPHWGGAANGCGWHC